MNVDAAYLYPARVMHRRLIAPLYHFVYRLSYLLLDIDRIGELTRLRWFSHNRWNLISFHDRDHGDGRPGGLRPWVERTLAAHDIDLGGGRIRLLVLPRILGFAFNPISIYYCEQQDGRSRAVIAEVRNTFGERHCYLLASKDEAFAYEQEYNKDKCFHVSPFMELSGNYRFRLSEPARALRVLIRELKGGAPILEAALAGERAPVTDAALLGQVLRMPWMTLKVVLAIHWEALKIWLRGARYVPKPPPPVHEVS